MKDVWDLVEEEANKPWEYGSGKPLFRSVLLRLIGGYVIMNIYHHAAGDGTTGMIVTRSILDNYEILRSGGKLEASCNKPLPCIEDLTMTVKDDNVLKTLIANKVDRAKYYLPFTPFDEGEMKTSQAESLPLNLTMIREGSQENLAAMRVKCRQEGVTLNSLALAAGQLAMVAVSAEADGQVMFVSDWSTRSILSPDVLAGHLAQVRSGPADRRPGQHETQTGPRHGEQGRLPHHGDHHQGQKMLLKVTICIV